jgi:hypothetical protein
VQKLGSSPSYKAHERYQGGSLPPPLTRSAGAALGRSLGARGRWLLAVDGVKLKGEDLEVRTGLEVQPVDAFALRAGWMFGQDAADLTVGAGIGWGSVQFDYAWVPYHDDLGASHRAGLSTRF